MGTEPRPTVLVVAGDPGVRRDLKNALERTYSVRTTGSGEEAVAELDAAPDVVLLGRRMQGTAGQEPIDRLRDRGYDGPVAMVCADPPESDIVQGPPGDRIAYLISRAELPTAVASVLRRAAYDDALREYYAVAAEIGTRESEEPRQDLASGGEYAELLARRDRLADRARTVLDELLEHEDIEALLADVVTRHRKRWA